MRYLSHDVLIPMETVQLGPFAIWRDPGRLDASPKSPVRALQITELLAQDIQRAEIRQIEIGFC